MAIKIAHKLLFKGHINTSHGSRSQKNNAFKKQIEEVFPLISQNSKPVSYIINYRGGGFIILSADDRMFPILAYSDKNIFPVDSKNYPGGVAIWLSHIKKILIKYQKVINFKIKN